MKKFLKGVRFFLCYLAITLATATGVVLVSQNSNANINNGNTGGNIIATDDNHLMDMVTEFMDMQSAGIKLDASLKVKDNPDQNVDLSLALELSLGENFSNIEASGDIDLAFYKRTINGESESKDILRQEKIAITYKDKNVYVEALGGNFCLNTDNLMTAINSALELFGIEMPSLGGDDFDPTSLLGYMGEYKEAENDDKTMLNMSLEFMGIKANIVCRIVKADGQDTRYVPVSISVKDAEIQGYIISANIALDLGKTVDIEKPDKTFVNIDNVTRVFNQLNEIKKNGFVALDASLNIAGQNINANILADFANDIKARVTTNYNGLTLGYKDNNIFTTLGNIKIMSTINELKNIKDFAQTDLKNVINSYDPSVIVNLETKLNDIVTSLKDSSKDIKLKDILDKLNNLEIADDHISYIDGDINVVITFENNNITEIKAVYQDYEVVLGNISLEKVDFEIDTNNFCDLADIMTVVKKLTHTIGTHGASGSLETTIAGNKLKIDFGVRDDGYVLGNIKVTALGKTISIITKDTTAYATFDGVNFKMSLDEKDDILAFVNEILGKDIKLPEIKNVLANTKFDISMLKGLKAINNGLELDIDGTTIAIHTNRDYISKINVTNSEFDIAVKLTEYGAVVLDSNTNKDYITFADLKDTIRAFANSVKTRAIGGNIALDIKDTEYAGDFKLNYINDALAAELNANIFGQDINVIYYNKTIYAKVKDVYLKASYDERYELAEYLNSKFDLDINVDEIINSLKSKAENMSSNPSLENVNISSLRVVNGSLILEISGNTITIDTKTIDGKLYLSSITYGNNVCIDNFSFGSDAIVALPNDDDYATYKTFANYFDEVERLINASKDETTDQYILSGKATLYKLNSDGTKATIDGKEDKISLTYDNMRFDATKDKNLFTGYLNVTGYGSLYNEYLAGYDHKVTAHFDSNFIYIDYNGLRAKFSKQSNSELINTLKSIVTNYLSDLSFSGKILEVFDMIKFDTMGNLLFNAPDMSKLFDNLQDYIPLLKTLRLNSDSSLDIGIDISSLVPSFEEEIMIKAKLDENNRLAIVISNLKLPNDMLLDFDMTVDLTGSFEVNPQESYMDMTSIGKFVSAFDKTAQKTTTDNKVYKAYLSGEFKVRAEIIGIPIDKAIPFTLNLDLDRTKKDGIPFEAKAYLDIPKIAVLNGTKKIYTTIYITDKLEGEPILYISRTGNELKSKYKLSEINANLVNIISDITNISKSTLASILSADIKYIDGPRKAENILKDYVYVASGSNRTYNIGIDLRQLSLMDMMKGYSSDNKTGVTVSTTGDTINTLSVNNITLEAVSGVYIYANANVNFANISNTQGVADEISKLDATAFGRWDDGSLIIKFVENGGSEVQNKMVQKGRSITLPTPTKEIETESSLDIYEFLGWCRNANLTDTPLTGDFLMQEDSDITFYAKWTLKESYTKHTINFVDNILNKTTSYSTFNSYDISANIPTRDDEVVVHNEELGVTIVYTFDGWYYGEIVDGEIVYGDKFALEVMGNEDITVYAKYTEVSRTYQRKLAIYDGDKELYLGYYVDGTPIDILSLVSHKDDTLWYEDKDFVNMYETLPTTMPSSDLNVYVRNKYTLTFTSSFGDKATKVITEYQGASYDVPTQNSYENTIYNGSVPNYLEAYIFGGYKLSSDITVSTPSVMPSQNMTFDATWEYQTLSYVKLSFVTNWARPNHWLSDGKKVSDPTSVADKYVLSGSVLDGTTLTKVVSIIDSARRESEEVRSTAKYYYATRLDTYTFRVVSWNTTKCVNYNTDSYTKIVTTITQNTTFYAEWKVGNY